MRSHFEKSHPWGEENSPTARYQSMGSMVDLKYWELLLAVAIGAVGGWIFGQMLLMIL